MALGASWGSLVVVLWCACSLPGRAFGGAEEVTDLDYENPQVARGDYNHAISETQFLDAIVRTKNYE